MAGEAGFEPTNGGVKVRCLTAWLHPSMVEGEGFEPSKAEPADLQSAPFGHSGTPPNCGAGDGTRTRNLLITSQLLCQLSYTGMVTPTGFEPVLPP